MSRPVLVLLLGAALLALGAQGFVVRPAARLQPLLQQQQQQQQQRSRSKGQAVALFDFFKPAAPKKAAPAAAVEDEKALTPAAARRAIKIPDNGPKLPALYNSWFDGTIVTDMANAVKAALKDGVARSEIILPPIPNVEELEFGTALNQRYNKEMAARLKAPENVSRKNLLAYANVDWANRLAQKIGKRTILAAFDNTVPASGVTLNKNAELVGIGAIGGAVETSANDVVVALQPGTETMWSKAGALKTPAPVIGLNAPFSLSYDIGYKPSKWEQIYVVRRITKGWVFRAYPNPYKAYIETPEGKCELLKVYEKGEVPKLRDVSKLIREETQARGYGVLSDRYITQRL